MGYKEYFWVIVTLSATSFSNQSETNGNFCTTTRRRHPTNCSLFFYCVNITMPNLTHVWIPGKCNFGLVFEPTLGMCVIPGSSSACQDDHVSKNSMTRVENEMSKYLYPAEQPNLEFETTANLSDELVDSILKSILFHRQYDGASNSNILNHKQIMNERLSSEMDYLRKQHEKWNNMNKGSHINENKEILPVGYPLLNPKLSTALKNTGIEQKDINTILPLISSSYWKDKLAAISSSYNYSFIKPNMETESNTNSQYFGSLTEKSPNILQQPYLERVNAHQNYFTDGFIRQDYDKSKDKNEQKSTSAEAQQNKHENEIKNYVQTERSEENYNNRINTSHIDTKKIIKQKNNTFSVTSPIIHDHQIGLLPTRTKSTVECKNGARQPNFEDCTKYYTCSSTGELISHICPFHTAFNAYTKKCEIKVYEDCLQQMHTIIPSNPEYDIYASDEPDNIIANDTRKEQPDETFKCTKEGKFHDTTSAQNYYICSLDKSTQTLIQHILSCPNSLQYCAGRKMCTFVENCN